MASATGIPEIHPSSIAAEEEPLLGRSGDVQQGQSEPIYHNFLTGTAVVGQAGIWVLTAVVWTAIFSHDLIFFSAHPLLNSAAILLQVQAILVLQPTSTRQQKTLGTYIHSALLTLSLGAFIAAFTIIEINKGDHQRLTSPHSVLGLITYIIIILQASVGVAQFWAPKLVFGSVENGKKIYKYHRISGYLLLVLEFATVSAATQTTFNLDVLHIRLWVVLVTAVITILGVGARIKKNKLGLNSA
ncbi:hypothetical protein BGW36DRAFT_203502 [Talaromyces proteolyticus]|uniref:Cytochrome b561 domain-containing protein n=1 Tax=Talaromyces proteolyticus TaxID=1131652 RepID=A0AAD4PWV6_9EURO|nr:uncharacterized protein BGW36DRAFT_203502 [Talaromyces proteolyticus]KAH8695515.1 hypothetical protein BGW36DRAFT_203502 [Talaromyces proteolyticus]